MTKTGQIRNRLTFIFKTTYLVLTMLTFNMFTNATPVLRYFSYFVAAFGALILLVRLFYFKEYKKTTGLWLLIGFSATSVISALLNFRYGGMSVLVENVQSFLWMTFCFFILYAYNENTTKADLLKEIRFIAVFLSVYNMIANIVSIYMLITGFYFLKVRGGTTVLGGFLWGRLWGVYTDPNHGAVVAGVCILFSLYAISLKAKGFRLVFHILNILISTFYITCSDSRTGIVALASGLAMAVYLFGVKKIKLKAKLLKYAVCILLSVIVAASVFAVSTVEKHIVTTVSQLQFNTAGSYTESKKETAIKIGREEDIEDDISNRRFSIWGSAFELAKKSPVFGTSFRGIVSFAKKVLPKTYLIHNDAGVFDCFHNSLLDILVSQGILGIAIFIAFAFVVFKTFFQGLAGLKNKENYSFFALLFSVIFLLSVSALFLSQIIFINSIGGIVFWIFLGYAMNYIRLVSNEEREECQA